MSSLKTFCFVFLLHFSLNGQILNHSWENLVLNGSDEWYAGEEALQIVENVLLYQLNNGGWPKNKQMHRPLSLDKVEQLKKHKTTDVGATIDNGATSLELIFLAKLYKFQKREKFRNAFLKGVDYLLEAQYESGGWPQFYPLRKGYYSHITYNDDAMVNVMRLLKSIMENDHPYNQLEIPKDKKREVAVAFQKGINCILKTQYLQNGKLTGWCAQHDSKTYLPAKARSYELPSLSGKESAPIVLLLMDIEKPTPRIVKAIEAAVQWFEDSKLKNTLIERVYDDRGKLISKNLIQTKDAPALWARFMNLENNEPFFCDRDGIIKQRLSEIGEERRLGYRWYTDQPKNVLKHYPKWKERIKKQREFPEKDLYDVVVAQDGTGHFATIQDAINDAKSFPYDRLTIFVKDGIYKEKVKIHEWNTNISLIGESKENTIISFYDNFDKIDKGRNSTFYTPTLQVEADDFLAKNLTVINTSGDKGQAVTLSVSSTRVSIVNCRLLGNQDTLYTSGNGKQYYRNCYIEGTTDFIFGSATAFFENCQIHSKKDSYITAASTPKGTQFGYVFKNCSLTAEQNVTKVYLGRPWRVYAQTIFINCDMAKHIIPQAWHDWSKPKARKTTFYAEYKNKGEGFKPSAREKWSHQLSKKEAKKYRKEIVLAMPWHKLKEDWYANHK